MSDEQQEQQEPTGRTGIFGAIGRDVSVTAKQVGLILLLIGAVAAATTGWQQAQLQDVREDARRQVDLLSEQWSADRDRIRERATACEELVRDLLEMLRTADAAGELTPELAALIAAKRAEVDTTCVSTPLLNVAGEGTGLPAPES